MDLREKISVIQNLIGVKNFKDAIYHCNKLLKQYPNISYIYNLCGLAHQGNREMLKSIELFSKALHYEPQNIAAKNNLANSYKHTNQNRKAEEIFKSIINQDPNNIKALNNYANLKKKINDFKSAKKLLLKALEIEPNEPNILFSLAECYQNTGDKEEAKNLANKVLMLQPKNPIVHKFISGLVDHNSKESNLETMNNIFTDNDFEKYSADQKMNLCFALGRAYEDIRDYKNSFKFLEKANLIGKQTNNYQISNDEELFNNIIKIFKSVDFKKISKKNLGKKIIFICGMPRSGTTLVEQIIASHSQVSGAGELEYLQSIVKGFFLEKSFLNKEKIVQEVSFEKNIVGEKYIDFINFHNFDTEIITDKAPQNFIWLGFVKIFFPNCKIIHCYRNPKDNCLSLYKNYFPSKDMPWSFDQKDIAKYYILYQELMDFWNSIFSETIFDVNYENLVNEPETHIRKIIKYCDLEWEDQCLKFHETKKTPIQTVSANQARQPIYKSSVDSNQKYSNYLSEMFNILDTNH